MKVCSFVLATGELSVADAIQSALLLTALVALFVTAAASRGQARTADFTGYLTLIDRFATAWRRFRDEAEPQRKVFEFAEVLNLLEASCHLYNKHVIRGVTAEMTRDYLKETLPTVFRDQYAATLIPGLFSGPDTFFHIRRFARDHDLQDVPHQ